MKLETSRGKVYDVRVVCTSIRRRNQVLVEIYENRPMHEIAEDFDGLASFRKYDEAIEGVSENYEGFSRLVGIAKNEDEGTVRLTLERNDGNG